jgi:hypothetical protein
MRTKILAVVSSEPSVAEAYRAQVLRQLDDPDAAGDEAAALMLRPPAQ